MVKEGIDESKESFLVVTGDKFPSLVPDSDEDDNGVQGGTDMQNWSIFCHVGSWPQALASPQV